MSNPRDRIVAIQRAIGSLEDARALLAAANAAPRTLARVRAAISSAKGARRHAFNAEARERRSPLPPLFRHEAEQ